MPFGSAGVESCGGIFAVSAVGAGVGAGFAEADAGVDVSADLSLEVEHAEPAMSSSVGSVLKKDRSIGTRMKIRR